MLRLVSSARSRLLRAGAFRAAGAVVPGTTRLAVERVPSQCHYEAPRCFSSDAKDHDRPWKTPALHNPVAWQETVKPAFLTFLKLNKHLMVPVKFVVPHGDDAWPEAAWGYPLGKHAEWLRKQWREGGRRIDQQQLKELEASYFDQIARAMNSLEAIAFDSKIAVSKWKNRVEPILVTFKQLHGHRNVPRDFVVPLTPPWREKDWGIQLGKLEPR
ncbi:hypothetical protein PF010_g9335 [Phytophthora fragariae]|uniref:Helicase-associated domain-containing protein n=1 Tax=Phytophthora fragariae TaxID=53985 RepID=A0A6G0LD44_9STRA|nr:hypothetical protein PF010_g9335 [Phytophthora fragariae]